MSFTKEEKNLILDYASSKPLDDEKECEKLGEMMGRHWTEIYSAYQQWLSSDVNVDEREHESLDVNANSQENNNNQENVEMFAGNVNDESNIGAIIEVTRSDNVECNNDLQFLNLDERLLDVNGFIYSDTNTLANINFETVTSVSRKRMNIEDLDTKLVETMIHQSEEELQLRREEHEKKMKIYEMHLQYGKELHKEKMEILKTKLKSAQEKLYHIDYAICNKNLHKRFKSGPI